MRATGKTTLPEGVTVYHYEGGEETSGPVSTSTVIDLGPPPSSLMEDGHPVFSEAVIDKARDYLVKDAVRRDRASAGVYWVAGSAKKPYMVSTDADPEARTASVASCTCPHGKNNPGRARCSHVVAVLVTVRDGLLVPYLRVAG